MRYEAYKGKKEKRAWAARAETARLMCLYIYQLAPGQYLELFPKGDGQLEHESPDTRLGYSHFALMVDDIHEAREELVKAGVEIDIEPNKGQSETWQMWVHDPDGNKFEIMQYTEKSLQHKGNIEDDRKKYGHE